MYYATIFNIGDRDGQPSCYPEFTKQHNLTFNKNKHKEGTEMYSVANSGQRGNDNH